MTEKDMRFTPKEADRILTEAAQREAKVQNAEDGTVTYNQLVEIAQESQIDPKYLDASVKYVSMETGGLKKSAVGRMTKQVLNFGQGIVNGYFIAPREMIRDTNHLERFVGNLAGIGGYGYTLLKVGPLVYTIMQNHVMSMWKEVFLVNTERGNSELRAYLVAGALATLTNAGSLLYEWYRSQKNKSLEEKIKESEDKK